MNSYKIKPKFPEDDGVRFPEELAKESAEHLKKAGYDASVVDKYYVQVNGDVDESELSRWGTIMNSRIIKSANLPEDFNKRIEKGKQFIDEYFAEHTNPCSEDDRWSVEEAMNYESYGKRYKSTDDNRESFYHINYDEINNKLRDTFEEYVKTKYSKKVNSSRQIKSARYIATDPESGEVLGSADTYEEAVNEWGEDVTITDSEVGDGQEENGLFSSWDNDTPRGEGWLAHDDGKQKNECPYERGTEEYEDWIDGWEAAYQEVNSSNQLNGDKAFLSNIISSVLSQSMTKEQAIKRVMLRNNCNIGYARQILSNAMDDASLIQSGTMEIAEDLNKDFNVDGDIESWSEDYVPQAGKANTIGGEILRATAQIVNRFYNDGDKIGIGNGKETVNPAARYILENAVELTEVPDELQAMLDNDSDINLSDESYEEWVDDFKYAVEDYLREHEELFHAPNKVDMWDFKQESDEKTPITDIFIEDDDGNRYSFQGGPEGWHCYDIYFADGPKYNVGDFVNSGDIQTAGGNTDDEFVTFNIDGYTYSAELYDNDEYEITDIESSNQLVHKDEEWTTEDLEKYKIYNSEDESELSIEDLY